MLPVILFILKLLGILLLVLSGILLGILLLALSVPVRYQVEGSFFGRVKGKARATWLLHMISVTAAFEDDFTVVIRLLGFRILKPAEENREDEEDMLVHAMEAADGIPSPDGAKTHKEAQAEDEPEKEPENEPEEEPENAPENAPENEKKPYSDGKHGPEGGSGQKRRNRNGRLLAVFAKLKFFFSGICDKLKIIKEKKEEIQSWISEEDNRRMLRLLLRQVKKLVCHLLPGKGKGKVTFGFEDPHTTGQVLAAASAVYPFCHRQIDIYPVFDRQVFTAEGYFKGRIRAGALLLMAGRMLFNKNFRVLLKRWL